jgi:beta-N-acetylhexosaminidase
VVRRPRLRLGPGASASARARRRRRLWPALGLTVAAIAAATIALAASGSNGPHFSFGPVSVVSSAAPKPALAAADSGAGSPPFRPAPAAVALAGRLSLPAQVAQLFLVSDDRLAGTPWGGVVLTSGNTPGDAAAVASSLRSVSAVAPLIAATQEGGPDTAFGGLPPEGEAAIGAAPHPVAVARAQASLAGAKLRSLGIDMTLAPLADVDTPGGALTGRLFGTDPALVARLSGAAVEGYAAAGEISAVGHFPGSGSASADPDQMTANVGGSLAELEGHDLVPFAAVARLAPVIEMSNASYVAFDGVTPAGLLPQAVQLLRRGYRFAGVVMTDDLDATLNATGSGPGTVALQALKAGDDLLYITGPPSEHAAAYDAVLAAAQRSAAVRALVRAALLRDLTLKARYGVLH